MTVVSPAVGVLIQARMSSARLPGKVLRPLAGRPLLTYVVERCARVDGAPPVAVITSAEPTDDPVVAWAEQTGVRCFRGPLDDVAGRFRLAAEAFGLDAFVRISGDSPLIDPQLIASGITRYRENRPDLVTNVQRRTFPAGMSVEVLDAPRFARACDETAEAEDREHVTRYYYRHPERFRIVSFEAARELGDRALVVDTLEDLRRIERIVLAMDRPHWEYGCEAVCALAERLHVMGVRPRAMP